MENKRMTPAQKTSIAQTTLQGVLQSKGWCVDRANYEYAVWATKPVSSISPKGTFLAVEYSGNIKIGVFDESLFEPNRNWNTIFKTLVSQKHDTLCKALESAMKFNLDVQLGE